jgi:hypothetical protein
MMIIQAKFKSVCPCCGKEISIGENVEWKKGSKAIHEHCHTTKHTSVSEKEMERIKTMDTISLNGAIAAVATALFQKKPGTKGWKESKVYLTALQNEIKSRREA